MRLTTTFERSTAMNKQIAILSGLFLIIFVGVSFGLSFLSPLRFVDPVYTDSPINDQLHASLNLDENYFLLTSVYFTTQEAQALDYVDSISMSREWPNRLLIEATAKKPVACSEETLYYVGAELSRNSRNDSLCRNVPQVLGDDLSEALKEELRALDSLLLQQITFLVETADYVTLELNRIEVTLYVSQVPKLSRLLRMEISSNTIDIRSNYA
jgi:cell division septal protein FtsQ